MPGAPPKLQFDDGTRIMEEGETTVTTTALFGDAQNSPMECIRPEDCPMETYYEINHVASSVLDKLQRNPKETCEYNVAVQFPDELLPDAANVCWLLEEHINEICQERNLSISVFLFLLGDTTHGACCVDEVAALHLSADLVVHYGRACLSPTQSLQVVYGFGRQPILIDPLIDAVKTQMEEDPDSVEGKDILLLYDLPYHYEIEKIASLLKIHLSMHVNTGRVPLDHGHVQQRSMGCYRKESGCCKKVEQECCTAEDQCSKEGDRNNDFSNVQHDFDGIQSSDQSPNPHQADNLQLVSKDPESNRFIVGGLEVELPESHNCGDLSNYILLYIGGKGKQLENILMRCSGTYGCASCWAYEPRYDGHIGSLSNDAASLCRRGLNRRYFLTQKARMASVIGIIVGSLANAHYTHVVSKIRRRIQESGRTSYTFAIGKINVHKLANFGEIDCFVLVACAENSLLDSRDYHVPIITPFELEIALETREWDGYYSLELSDYLGLEKGTDEEGDDKSCNSDDSDKPFFSVVTGKFESSRKNDEHFLSIDNKNDTEHESTGNEENRIIAYHSKGAEYLKGREYQGLQAKIGEDVATPAVKGQMGIASDYGNR